MNNVEGRLSAFTKSLYATNVLVFGYNVGAAKSIGKNWEVAQILVLPVDGTIFL